VGDKEVGVWGGEVARLGAGDKEAGVEAVRGGLQTDTKRWVAINILPNRGPRMPKHQIHKQIYR